MVSKSLVILFSAFSQLTLAQVLQNGLILPPLANRESYCCIYTPKDGFTVYNAPDGIALGKLTKNASENKGNQAPYRIYFVNLVTREETELQQKNFQEIGDEIWCIRYFERRNGFVRVADKAVDFWLAENEIKKSGFAITEWQTFLSDNSETLLGLYANEPGLNLREEPLKESNLLKTLRGDLFEIKPTKEHRGLWTKVKVVKRKQHPCESNLGEKENVEYTLEGWIKIVDDSGTPNVFFYARGC
jgi:hypothetical protein